MSKTTAPKKPAAKTPAVKVAASAKRSPTAAAPAKARAAAAPTKKVPVAAKASKVSAKAPVTAPAKTAKVATTQPTAAKPSTTKAKVTATPKPAPQPAPTKKAAASARPAKPPPMPKVSAPVAPAPPTVDRPAPVAAQRPAVDASLLDRPARKIDPKLASAWKTKSARELTDAEVLSMPDSEYMGEQQLAFFKAKLEAQKDDLLSNAGETTEHLREDTTIVPDPADRATIEEEHALELRTRDRERKLLKKITQAISRIDTGEYGFCDETGEPIGLGRLIARPTATLTLEAQQRRELKQKMYGD